MIARLLGIAIGISTNLIGNHRPGRLDCWVPQTWCLEPCLRDGIAVRGGHFCILATSPTPIGPPAVGAESFVTDRVYQLRIIQLVNEEDVTDGYAG
ncbi:MAG TPA: hypothetical protein VMW38_28405 [Terriglobia bacterium]|nr:hypothetical protein [Terriglobia bacterium]